MGRVLGLILSLLGGIALGLGAYALLQPPEAGWASGDALRLIGTSIAPALALWFAAWIAFTMDGLTRDMRALRQDVARTNKGVTRIAKALDGARARAQSDPSQQRRG